MKEKKKRLEFYVIDGTNERNRRVRMYVVNPRATIFRGFGIVPLDFHVHLQHNHVCQQQHRQREQHHNCRSFS